MSQNSAKIMGEALTYDDVLLQPAFSKVLPREVQITTRFTRNIPLRAPIASAAMDTVTESAMAIAIAQDGGIGVLHKNMTIEQQAVEVRNVKRAESGMILDPVTLPETALPRSGNPAGNRPRERRAGDHAGVSDRWHPHRE
jgi:IMP dehydrogenase